MAAANVNDNVRYEPDENPPRLVTVGSGVQAAVLILAPVVLTVVIVSRIAGQSEGFMTWAVFAALLVSGSTTILQAVRVGRFGSGHVLMMGTSGAFIAVCVAALKLAGPATMASLIVISSLFQFLAGVSTLAAAPHFHAGCYGHRDHADRGHGDAHHLRFAQ